MKKYIVPGIILLVAIALIWFSLQKPIAPTDTTINNIANTTSPDDLALIKQALVTKSKWPADKIVVTVLQNTGDHARGGVSYQNESGVEGGYWFAVKETDKWRIVLDGSSSIPCSKMTKEGFPDAMIPDCQ